MGNDASHYYYATDDTKRQRVLQLMEHLAVSQSGLAKLIHMSQGYISHIVSGKKPMTRKFVRHLREYAGVNVDWLLTGRGEMFDPSFSPPQRTPELNTDQNTSFESYKLVGRSIPLVAVPQHGSPLGSWNQILIQAPRIILPPVMDVDIEVIFRIPGLSLYPRIKPDALLFARPLQQLEHLPSGKEHIYALLVREAIKIGYIDNHCLVDKQLTLYYEDDSRNKPELIATEEVERLWYVALVLQVP